LKFITEHGVDVHTFVLEIHDVLGLPPFETTNTTHTGVGIYGLLDDVFAVLPVHDLKELYYTKLETREYLKTVVKTIHTPVFVVSIHCVYLNFVSCCLCYVHTSE